MSETVCAVDASELKFSVAVSSWGRVAHVLIGDIVLTLDESAGILVLDEHESEHALLISEVLGDD